mmetsp:Transcript_83650/g.236101  ORF Transcript_83650/g.236101 Transcript_83650/m.236101 type:complete len:210 (-) Transcript_83650:1701-2330(-)
MKRAHFILLRIIEPVISMPSQRTTTTFWPARSSLATVEARRPRMWPEPSITISFSNILAAGRLRCWGSTRKRRQMQMLGVECSMAITIRSKIAREPSRALHSELEPSSAALVAQLRVAAEELGLRRKRPALAPRRSSGEFELRSCAICVPAVASVGSVYLPPSFHQRDQTSAGPSRTAGHFCLAFSPPPQEAPPQHHRRDRHDGVALAA